MRSFLLAVALTAALAASPVLAVSMSTAQFAQVFCIAREAGDMAPIMAMLTPELSALVASHLKPGDDPALTIPWQSTADYANTCDPVGAQGTTDTPVSILAYGFREAGKNPYADGLVFRWVDERIRLDDIKYGVGGDTLRQRLAAMP